MKLNELSQTLKELKKVSALEEEQVVALEKQVEKDIKVLSLAQGVELE